MDVKKFIIQICSVFLSVTLSKTIEKVITEFSLFALMVGILTFFLSLNFFYAKFKQLNEIEEKISGFGFAINISTLMCFSAMPFFVNSLVGIMGTQIFLRISDMLLILYNSKWDAKKINQIEKRWLFFDVIYFIVVTVFIVISLIFRRYFLDVIFIGIYLLMGIFESIFDFYINRDFYGINFENLTVSKDKTTKEGIIKQ